MTWQQLRRQVWIQFSALAAITTLVSTFAFSNIQTIQALAATAPTTIKFVTYKDSRGRFTIDYPSAGWTVTPAKNRFEEFDVKFTSTNSSTGLAIKVSKLNGIEGNNVEPLMSLLPTMARIGTPNFELIQDVECKKYTIDGHKACSMINTQTPDYISQTKAALLSVDTLVNGTTYRFMYASTPDDFDSNLPVIDKMISSFRILSSSSPS